MALAVAEMPAIGTYDFGWVAEHVCDSEEQADSGGDRRVILVDVGGGQDIFSRVSSSRTLQSHPIAACWETSLTRVFTQI